MSSLRDLSLITPLTVSTSFKFQQLAICDAGRETSGVQNGGRCCCWLVPTGVTYAIFELWGGGGDGAGACCCAGPYITAGSGHYVRKAMSVSGQTFFNICAASSGCCGTPLFATCGFPSYVTNCSGTVMACAPGGIGACAMCGHMGGTSCVGICVGSSMYCSSSCGDVVLGSITSVDKQSNYCTQHTFQFQQGPHKFQPNTRHGYDPCTVSMTRMGCCYFTGANSGMWPGGGGATAQACAGGCCWGSWGLGGLVLITYA